jgi:hypothetical protein
MIALSPERERLRAALKIVFNLAEGNALAFDPSDDENDESARQWDAINEAKAMIENEFGFHLDG